MPETTTIEVAPQPTTAVTTQVAPPANVTVEVPIVEKKRVRNHKVDGDAPNTGEHSKGFTSDDTEANEDKDTTEDGE